MKKINKFLILLYLIFFPITTLAVTTLQNPLGKKINSIEDVFANVVSFLLGFVGMISLVYFIIGGFYWLTAMGNQDRIKKGKDTLIWAVLGLLVSLGSYAILRAIIGAVTG